ncbi:MAG: glycosyltransferase family 39 protein [Bacteroidetes bacterium]|nr:glycosyltransferase family 39 protein [Bacteroidota bacterium]
MKNKIWAPVWRHFPAVIWLLLAVSFAMRAFLAWWLELGNDEVYYWTYALYPDLSHFDHPPMVGLMIQLFSANLLYDNELFIRLSSVVLMSVNTLTVFSIGRLLRGERAGLIAAMLYNTSVYAFVITGIFILPDTPQNFFWLLSLLFLLRLSSCSPEQKSFARLWLAFGLMAGLGMLSKYTSVFLWSGAAFFVLLHRPAWLRTPWPWLAAALSFLVFLPVVVWNWQNDFISLSFHGGRVSPQAGLKPQFFARELAGQWLYNNPVTVGIIWAAILAWLRKVSFAASEKIRLIALVALPPVVLFLAISLFRATLPHWTGPAYVSLIPLAAAWLDSKSAKPQFPGIVFVATALLLLVVWLGAFHVRYGLFSPTRTQEAYHRLGKDDPGLDMYGYRQLLPEFSRIRVEQLESGSMANEAGLVGENWFPLANYDYYIARPLGLQAFGIGEPHRLHKYMWINRLRGGLRQGADYWYLTNSRDYKHPAEIYGPMFSEIIAVDTVTIMRNGKPAKRHFVFILKDLRQLPPDPLEK